MAKGRIPVPLTRVFMKSGKSSAYRAAILDNVYTAMRETFDVPEGDRFMVITQHNDDCFSFSPNYLDIERSDDLVIIQITCNKTRTVDQKKALYARTAERLSKEPGIRSEDVFINLIEVSRENWSFGNGKAQYAVID
jgi:4-oxalocrotonate tautomerase